MKKFLIIDGNSLANRAFYAMPYLSNIKAQPSGAIFGFANILIKLITEQKPDYIAVAFDHARQTFRNQIYSEYKGTRGETPPELISQFANIKEMLAIMGIKTFEVEGIEADDIIGTLAKNSGVENIILSGDRDLLQLVNKTTKVWLTIKGVTDLAIMDEKAIQEKYGFTPPHIVDMKALMGDSSDNIPGVAGIGEKTALSLLSKYKDLDDVYANIENITGKLKEKLIADKQNAEMSKLLATIKTDCEIGFNDIEECTYYYPFADKVREFFEYWGFNSFTKRDDIFENEKKPVSVERVLINSVSEVDALIKSIRGEFAYKLDALEFCSGDGKVYYVEKDLDLFSAYIGVDEVFARLKGVFEDKNICKITISSKNDIKRLNKLGINLENFFDIEIARYLCYTSISKTLPESVAQYFDEKQKYMILLKENELEYVYNSIEIPLVRVLVDMEETGFKIDEKSLDEIDKKFDGEIAQLSSEIFAISGEEFNINSPKQVATILFDKLGIKSMNNSKRSTSVDVLEELRYDNEIVDLIIRYRKVYKLKSTYTNVYKNICETSGNVVHTVFNQTQTNTGRLSSSDPNMQNIPTRDEEGKMLRKIFISKFEGGKIISADYNQIELRLLANLADERSMIEAYKKGADIHTATASEIYGVDVDLVTPNMRRDAKAVNFGIIYGISDYGLSQSINTSFNKAKKYIENYFSTHPMVKKYMDDNVKFAKENGYAKTYFGRRRPIPEIESSNYMVRKFGERVAMNMPLQGTASDIIKLAMIATFNKLKGMKSHIILQVHDELIIDTHPSEVEVVAKMIKEIMENVADFEVPLIVNVGVGDTLYDCK